MDINIIIDKSTFQSLNQGELIRLSSYFRHNIAPVLVMEIIGDLKKQTTKSKTPPEIRIIDFANKLFPVKNVINTHYWKIIEYELFGNEVILDGRPFLDMKEVKQEDFNRKGFIIEETVEERAIYKWREGKITEADHQLSQLWRTLTTKEDILINLRKILRSEFHQKLKSFDDLNARVKFILSNQNLQPTLFAFMVNNYISNESDKMKTFQRWKNEGSPLISKFAPYTAHCLKVDLLFQLGLQSDLIGTRPTNLVDIEYLYYLPFCSLFTSNDKIHKNLIHYLLRDNQRFILGEELKKDLKKINEYLESEDEEIKKKYASEPPQLDNSAILKIWQSYFIYPTINNRDRNKSDKFKQTMEKILKSTNGEKVDFDDGEAVEFIVRKSLIRANDPCICGSGKKLIECCVSPEEFLKHGKKIN